VVMKTGVAAHSEHHPRRRKREGSRRTVSYKRAGAGKGGTSFVERGKEETGGFRKGVDASEKGKSLVKITESPSALPCCKGRGGETRSSGAFQIQKKGGTARA